jgi:hypothetical protein
VLQKVLKKKSYCGSLAFWVSCVQNGGRKEKGWEEKMMAAKDVRKQEIIQRAVKFGILMFQGMVVGAVVGPLMAYCFIVVLYCLGMVSHFALKEWEEAFMIGWGIAIPAGALIGGLRLGYRASMLIGALVGVLFCYIFLLFALWQGKGKFPSGYDFTWMLMTMFGGVMISLPIKWLGDKWAGQGHTQTDSKVIEWLSVGTICILLFAWWLAGHLMSKSTAKAPQARLISVEYLSKPSPQGILLSIRVEAEAKEPIKSVYLVDAKQHGLHTLKLLQAIGPSRYSFGGELLIKEDKPQKFFLALVTPSGRLSYELVLPQKPAKERR